jgi:hypothetical protein
MGETRNAYRIMMRKSEDKRPLERSRPRRRWVDNIKIDLREIWIELAQDRDQWRALVDTVNTVMNLRVP